MRGVLLAAIVTLGAGGSVVAQGMGEGIDSGCLSCHGGIEEMHPWLPLSCTDCHGGAGDETVQARAHVAPAVGWPADERVMHENFDPKAVRFRNPGDLRILDQTCGRCHADLVDHLALSLHGTTAGHLNDGLYENGILERRASRYGIFPVVNPSPGPHELDELISIDRLRGARRDRDLGDHFSDLPRKACMQCHLYSDGFAVRGRLGMDGLYRGSGCAACHVTYAENGKSQSSDPVSDRFEPGHPVRHEMTSVPPVETCATCHVGDASIGNGFRGLAQLYPSQPAGPDIPGTTNRLLAQQFFVSDPLLTPPDIHHAAGMHCIDCHTRADIMGDGNLYGAMEHGVEIECVDCHGTLGARSDLLTSRGGDLPQLEQLGDLVVLRGKVDGKVRRVKQVMDVVDPESPDYNERAALAMTHEHDGLECYACHSGWNTNFFGFHFDRNEAFSQLDLIRGSRTEGRVSTQERVFATLRQFVLGVNPEGMVAPYMVGFSTMGTVRGPDGEPLPGLDQALPETAAGLSGMTMVHHQTHTTQPAARSCIECHRSPATWGLGTGDANSSSFTLARGMIYVVGESGLELILLDRENPANSTYVSRLPLGGARKVVVDSDPVSGRAGTAFVVIEGAGVALVDVRNPAFPAVRAFVAAGDARNVALAGDLLVIANGRFGLRVVDVGDRDQPELVSDLTTREARGLSLQWPRALVADGPGGLVIADLSVPRRPRIVGQVDLGPVDTTGAADAEAVAATFQYGRPRGHHERTEARMIAVVANGGFGAMLVDVTEPSDAKLFSRRPDRPYGGGTRAVDVAVTSRFDLGDTSGLQPTVERDVAYVLLSQPDRFRGSTLVLDVTDPSNPAQLDRVNVNGNAPFGAALVRSFNPPQLVSRFVLATDNGLLFQDVTLSEDATNGELLGALAGSFDLAAEAFAFDRMLDETGRQLKDISHEDARYLSTAEIHAVLSVPGDVIGTLQPGGLRRADLAQRYDGQVLDGGEVSRGRSDADEFERTERLLAGYRLSPQEDMARLVRHVDPRDFDKNNDRALSRGELERLLFTALDGNADGRLDLLEWPRHPGADPGQLDRNGDGAVMTHEMDVGADVLRFYDVDGDGRARFDEWPWEVPVGNPLPTLLYTDLETILDLRDDPAFQRRRPEITAVLSSRRDNDEAVDLGYLMGLLAAARANPIRDMAGELSPGGFLERWDLDADGAVEPWEWQPYPRLADRCDLDGNGRIDLDDRPDRD